MASYSSQTGKPAADSSGARVAVVVDITLGFLVDLPINSVAREWLPAPYRESL